MDIIPLLFKAQNTCIREWFVLCQILLTYVKSTSRGAMLIILFLTSKVFILQISIDYYQTVSCLTEFTHRRYQNIEMKSERIIGNASRSVISFVFSFCFTNYKV